MIVLNMKILENILNRFKHRSLFLMLSFDIFSILTALLFSFLFRYEFQISHNLIQIFSYSHIFILIFLKVFIFRLFSLYRGLWRYTSIWDLINIIKANIITSFFLYVIIHLYSAFELIPRSIIFIDLI